jgi:hypothetical protein
VVQPLLEGVGGEVEVAAAVLVGHLHAHSVEGHVRVHVDAAQGIDNAHQPRKVDPGVIVHVHVIQLLQALDGLLDAVEAEVGELILLALGGEGQVVVPGGADQQNLVGGGVHNSQNIGIAAAVQGNIIHPLIGAAAIHHEGLPGNIGVGGNGLCIRVVNGEPVNDLGVLGEILIPLRALQDGEIAVVEDDGVHLLIQQSIGQLGQGAEGFGLHLAHAVLDVGQQGVGVLPVQGLQDAIGIAEGVVDGFGLVIRPDHHGNGGLGGAAGGDVGQELHKGACGGGGEDHGGGEHQGHHGTDQLPGHAAAHRQLHKGVQSVEKHQHQDEHDGQRRGQYTGVQHPHQQDHAAHQHTHQGQQSQPICRAAASAPGTVIG